MNQNQFEETTLGILDECREMLRVKNADYAGEHQDKLSGFKKIAARCNCSPFLVWQVLFSKHLDAIETYLASKQLKSEPIHGRLVDGINYFALLDALIVDEEQSHESQGDAAKTSIFPPPLNKNFIYSCCSKDEYDMLNTRQDWRDAKKKEGYTHFGWLGLSGQEIWPLN